MSKMSPSPQRKERSAADAPLPVLWAQMVLGLPSLAAAGPSQSAYNDAGHDGPSTPPGVPPGEGAEPTSADTAGQ